MTLLRVFEKMERKGRPSPLQDRKELNSDQSAIYEAFASLSSGRSTGWNGPEAIQVSEVLAYCDLVGLQDQFERRLLLRAVQSVDRVWLMEVAKMREQDDLHDGRENSSRRHR